MSDITQEEFWALQREWEDIDWSPHEDIFERQKEIDEILDACQWAINPDNGQLVPAEHLMAIVNGEMKWEQEV